MSSVGQVVGGVVGGVIGFFAGGNVMLGASIGMALGGAIDPPKGPKLVGPKLDDLTFQTSTLGASLGRAYGTVSVLGNVIWLEGDQYKEVTTTEEQGGKGGGGQEVETTTYYATFAVSLLQVPDANSTVSLRRVWIGSNLVYEAGSGNTDSILASNMNMVSDVVGLALLGEGLNVSVNSSPSMKFVFYSGTDDQQPHARWQADKGMNAVSGFPGRCYIVIEDLDLTKYSNSLAMAQVKCELVIGGGILEYDKIVDLTGLGYDVGRYKQILGAAVSSSGAAYWGFEGRSIDNLPLTLYHYNVVYGESQQIAGSYDIPDNWGGGWITPLPVRLSQSDVPIVVFLNKRVASNTVRLRFVSTTGRDEYTDDYIADEVPYGGGSSCVVEASSTWLMFDSNQKIMRFSGTAIAAYSVATYSVWHASVSENYLFAVDATSSSTSTTVFKFDKLTLALVDTFTESVADSSASLFVASDDVFYTASDGHIYKWEGGVVVDDWGAGSTSYDFGTTSGEAANGLYFSVSGDHPRYATFMTPNANAVNVTAVALWMTHETVVATPAKLHDIVVSECSLVGIAAGDIDNTALTNHDVRGVKFVQKGAVRSNLEVLQAAFPFDVAASGYKLRFVSRGTSSLATIPTEDLGASGEKEDAAALLPISREMDSQLPQKVSVRYVDPVREYDIGEQYSERPGTASNSERTVDLPISFTAGEAAQIADVLLSKDWVERVDFGPFSLPPTWLALEAADVVTLEHRGQSHQVRLNRVEYLPDGRLQCSAKLTASQSYTSTASGEDAMTVGQTLVPLRGTSYGLLLDIPTILSAQDKPGIAAAAYGLASGWPGATILRSDDSGNTYSSVLSTNVAAAVFGCAATLGAGRSDVIDTANVLTLTEVSKNPTLSSVSFASAAAGQNLAVVGANGRWEVISFLTVVDNADDTWTIRDLVRGRFGTEWAMPLHAASDLLIVLAPTAVGFIGLPLSAVNSARLYRTVTHGAVLDSAADASFTYAAANLRPLSPIRLNGSRHPTTYDWTLTCTRRSRTPVEPFSGVPTPLGESAESYEVEIWDSGFATLKRTLTTSSESVSYTAVQQIADHGSEQSTLYVKWYQLSSSVGRGYALSESIYRYLQMNAYSAQMVLALHLDGTDGSTTFTDLKGHTFTATGNARIRTAASKFGGASAYFDGTGDYIQTASSTDFDFGTGDFTIRGWVKPDSVSGAIRCVFSRYGAWTSNVDFYLRINTDGTVRFLAGDSVPIDITSTATLSTSEFKLVEISRASGTTRLWVAGVYQGQDTSAATLNGTAAPVCFGADSTAGENYAGYLDDFEMYKGVALHSANTDYTPPTGPFPDP